MEGGSWTNWSLKCSRVNANRCMYAVVCVQLLLPVFKDLCVCGYLEGVMYFLLYKWPRCLSEGADCHVQLVGTSQALDT